MKKIVLLSFMLLAVHISFGQAKKIVVQKKGVNKKKVVVTKSAVKGKQNIKLILNTEIQPKEDKKVYMFPEVMAEYPGGEDNLLNYLEKNINYPRTAIDSNIQGRVVIEFQVCTDGQLCNLKVVKSLSKETDEEAIRVIKNMKTWKPAKIKGQPVASYYSLPISFILEN